MRMKLLKFIMCLAFILAVSGAFADELPLLTLEEGKNEIVLSIVNSWNKDLNDVVVVIDREKLPSWLSISEGDQKIDVIRGKSGKEKLILVFYVTDAPSNAFAKIPYSLKDNRGNIWNFTVKVTTGEGDGSAPEAFDALYENFPNPFNPTTTIKYSLKENRHTKLVIYNSLGQVICTLVNDRQDAGIHNVRWDGKDEFGKQVSSGLYIYRLKAGSFVKTRRMTMLE